MWCEAGRHGREKQMICAFGEMELHLLGISSMHVRSYGYQTVFTLMKRNRRQRE